MIDESDSKILDLVRRAAAAVCMLSPVTFLHVENSTHYFCLLKLLLGLYRMEGEPAHSQYHAAHDLPESLQKPGSLAAALHQGYFILGRPSTRRTRENSLDVIELVKIPDIETKNWRAA